MRISPISAALACGLLAGCAFKSTVKPVEMLDERTGVTVAALQQPIELVPSAQYTAQFPGNRPSFAYLGPVEWDQAGTLSYGLWIHIAPGNGPRPGDIRARGALTLMLDDGPLALSRIDAPPLGQEPYPPVASWGQSAYFDLSVETLRRIAASRRLTLEVRAAEGSPIDFFPTHDARTALTEYLRARGIADD